MSFMEGNQEIKHIIAGVDMDVTYYHDELVNLPVRLVAGALWDCWVSHGESTVGYGWHPMKGATV